MPSTEGTALDATALSLLGELAASAIRHAVTSHAPVACDEAHARFAAPGASFVTLKQDGRLRGCIGTLVAHRPLSEDVAANARAAALRDPRFAPLAEHELPLTEVEVSVLSTPTPMAFVDETDFFQQLRAGIDGLIVEYQGRRATYLPSVWQQLPDARMFVRELRRKAGIEDAVPLMRLSVERYITRHSSPRSLVAD